MDTIFAQTLLDKMTSDYDAIADHFSQTRQAAWPEFDVLATITQPGQKLLDVGCGNGRLAATAEQLQLHYIGLDVSKKLLELARQQFPAAQFPRAEFVRGSMLQLPFPDATFHVCAAMASLQHIPSVGFRLQALRELYHVTKPGGYLFMLNWNLYQGNRAAHLIMNDPRFDMGDALVPWKDGAGVIQAERYYHGFTLEELTHILTQTGWNIERHYYSTHGQAADQTTGHNIVTLAQKH